MARPLRRDEEGVSNVWSFIGVLILVVAILGVYYGYVVPRFPGAPLRAQSGDIVQVNYIGTFSDTGLVFDTSLLSVGQDNASYPKALSFTWHAFQPFAVSVGSGGVVKGFDRGIQGMAVGETKRIVVPPDLGYGPADPTKIFVKPLIESVPVRLTLNATDFVATYRAVAVSGTNVTDPFWGWSAYVTVADSVVTVTNSPVPGEIVRPYGAWNAQVVSIDDGANAGRGAIVVRHLLDASDIDRTGVITTNPQTNQRSIVFVVAAVDLAGGTYTLNYNTPTNGRTLVFQVTMLSISRSY